LDGIVSTPSFMLRSEDAASSDGAGRRVPARLLFVAVRSL